jgi:hypothetical protein
VTRWWKRLLPWTRDFFAAVPGALKNHLNSEELARISVAALAAGSGVFGLLQAILLNSGTIFPSPIEAALATAILTTVLECHRRLGQGRESTAGPKRIGPAR